MKYLWRSLGLSILELLMYEVRYDYVKQNYGEKANLRYMDRDTLDIVSVYAQKEMIIIKILEDINYVEKNKLTSKVFKKVINNS